LLLDVLNANIPHLPLPSDALTLHGSVKPTNLELFAARIDGAGKGAQDYFGLSANVEPFVPSVLVTRYSGPAKRRGIDPGRAPQLAKHEEPTHIAETGKSLSIGASPNPFNPTTRITLSLPAGSAVRVNVFNVRGEKVATIADRYLEAGSHSFVWDAKGLASGVYFCRMEAAGQVSTVRTVLLK
jgi:hypothetical protein